MKRNVELKRVLRYALITLCAILALALCACDDVSEPIDDNAVPALELTNEAGEGIYTVVRSDFSSQDMVQASLSLRKALQKAYGVDPWPIMTDWEKNPDPAELASRYEFLVGETNRPESAAALAKLGEHQYIVQVSGNKIVLIGCDERHTEMAVDYFIETYLPGEDGAAPLKALFPGYEEILTREYTALSTVDGPIIVPTVYSTEDVVVADIYLSEDDYKVDPTGEDDSTAAIQAALNTCHQNGGGTVFLPAGTYRITKNITVPAFVCLRGDWQDPDTGSEYGTIIIADVKSKQTTEEGLIKIGGSAGAYGLTIYYPNQSLDNPQPYPATFFVASDRPENFMASTVRNVTVVNGYEGIRTHATMNHEQLTVENFKGTFLSIGLHLTNSSDVGTCTNISVRPNYWSEFASAMGYTVPDAAKVKAYTRANATGFEMGDLEWTEFIHITVTDCKYGLRVVDGARASFAGSFYDTVVMDCDVALQADDMDARWGMHVSNSYLVGSKNGIVINSNGINKIAGTTVKGGLEGVVLVDTDNLTKYAIDTGVTYQKPAAVLYTDPTMDKTGKEDVSAKLQALLDKAAPTGGVVYLPAGTYRLEAPVSVPTGVELRGCSSLPQREQSTMSRGTMIRVIYGQGGSATDTAAVTLAPSSGVNGIRFQYWDNNGSIRETAYTVRGTGANVYLVNCEFMAAGRGVDFSGCDNHLIKKLTTFCYINDIRVGGEGGYVVGMLHNCTVMDRHGLSITYPATPGYASNNHVAREYNASIVVENAKNQTIFNCFSYGVRNLIHQINSENTLAVNIGADNIGDRAPQLLLEGGSFVAINVLRFNGVSCEYTEGTSVRLYSRLGINERREDTLIVN